jgi:hypothetical protein
MAMPNEEEIIALIRDHHKQRRFAMKIQQKLDRALESFIRVNATKWQPDLDEAERKKINVEVKELIKALRSGDKTDPILTNIVAVSDKARWPADEMRKKAEDEMEKLAVQLRVYPWIEKIHGVAAPGLATIVAEAGDLSKYPNPAKLWNRLGFAPYDGFAGSTWKRETWRPRALTKEEWIEHPFNGARYALIHQIALWLVNAQTTSKLKNASGRTEPKPNSPYGELYCKRYYEITSVTHPDWSDGHRRMDALRVTMKHFLVMLWAEWTGNSANKRRGRSRPAAIRKAKAFLKRHEERIAAE